MFRRRRREAQPTGDPVDLAGLRPRWRATVEEAVSARSRFRALVDRAAAGPMAERLAVLATSIDEGVLATYRTAARAQAAEDALIEMNPEVVNDQLKAAKRRGSEAEIELLAAQHSSVNRLMNSVDDAEEQLRMLDLRLDAAVARAAELILRPTDTAAVGQEIDALVTELDALRQAMETLD